MFTNTRTDIRNLRISLRSVPLLAGLLCALYASLADAADSNGILTSQLAKRAIVEIPVPLGMQDVAFDARHQELFVQYVHKVDGQELAGVARYDIRSPGAPRMLDALKENSILGHQGLSLERAGDTVRLWSSMGEGGGRYAIRFGYQANEAPADVERYKLFGDDFIESNVTMPKVCLQENLLIARGRKSSRTQIIRVFDLRKLRQGADKDVSNAYLRQWTIDPQLFRDGFPLQGIACNEKDGTIHLVAGKSNLAGDKRVHVYDFEGHFLRSDERVSIGMSEAVSENGSYEPEGMAYYFSNDRVRPSLVLSVVSGRGKHKVMRLWPIDHIAGQ